MAISTTALALPASTISESSLNVPHGVAPTTPVNGDVWGTTSGFFTQINGITVDLARLGIESVSASTNITKFKTLFTGSTVGQVLTLPTGTPGVEYQIRNSGSVAVTVARSSSDTIEGATTFVLNPGEAISLTFVGTDWTVF